MEYLGIDETASRKRHEYVIIVSDQKTGYLLHLGDDRKKEWSKEWNNRLSEEQRVATESVSTDMWPAFIHATLESTSECGGEDYIR